MLNLLITLIAAQAASVGTATQPTPAAPPTVAAEKRVCRQETPTGSYFSKKICHTKTEWRSIDVKNEANMDDYSRTRTRK